MKYLVRIELVNLTLKPVNIRDSLPKVFINVYLALSLLIKMLEKDPKKRVSATQALNSSFFKSEEQMMLENNSPVSTSTHQRGDRPLAVNVERNNSMSMECDSPLMTTKNQTRKQGRLRDDSCLKFKMKENINLSKPEEGA